MKNLKQFRQLKNEQVDVDSGSIDENMKKRQDAMRVAHGAMSRDEFRRKWGKKKPAKYNPIHGPGGVYKNVTRSESVENVDEGLEDACWKGYEAIGMKMKNGKKVPNCVPKEGHAEDAQTAHQAAHAALKKGDVNAYHQEMDKKFAAHQAAEKEASNKPVMTFEAADDEKNLKITKHSKLAVEAEKRGDKGAQQYHLNIVSKLKNESVVAEDRDRNHNQGPVLWDKNPSTHLVDVQIIKKGKTSVKRVKVQASNPANATSKASNRLTLHGHDVRGAQHHSVIGPGPDVRDEAVAEATDKNSKKHLITVTVTDPNHSMVSKRKEKIMKRVKVSADDPKGAVAKAEAHYKKHGFKVHDALHHSVIGESLDTDEFVDQYDTENENGNSCEANQNPQKGIAEAEEQTPAEDKETIDRVKTLIRLGLLDMSQLNAAVRVMKKLELDQPITSTQEREVLGELLEKLIGIVTGDDTIFRKVRLAVSK